MPPRRFIRDSIGFALSQVSVRAAMIVRTLVAARMLGPQDFGAWTAIQLLMDYGLLAPLGTQQGLDQIVPRRLAEGDVSAIERVKRAGLTSVLLLSLLYACVCLGYFLQSTGKVMYHWGIAGLLVAMLVVLQINWGTYSTGVLRSHGNIAAVSRWYFVQGMVGAICGLALIPWLGVWGLLWGWVIGTFAAFALTQWSARGIAAFRPLISADSLMLIRVGFPMYLFTGLSVIMRNLDRLIILRFLGTQELGYYSLAVTAVTLVLYLPDSATFVFYPRLVHRFRESGDRPEAVRDSVVSLLRVLALITPAFGGVAYMFVKDIVGLVLPSFFNGARAAQVLCFTASAVCVTSLASIVLMTLGRQMWLIPLALLGTIAFAAADIFALQRQMGITGIAWATLLTYMVLGAVSIGLALRALRFPLRTVLRRVLITTGCTVAALVLAPLAQRYAPWSEGGAAIPRILHAVTSSAMFLAAYALVTAGEMRGLGIRQVLNELQLPFAGLLRRFGNGDGPSA